MKFCENNAHFFLLPAVVLAAAFALSNFLFLSLASATDNSGAGKAANLACDKIFSSKSSTRLDIDSSEKPTAQTAFRSAVLEFVKATLRIEKAEASGDISPSLLKALKNELAAKRDQIDQAWGRSATEQLIQKARTELIGQLNRDEKKTRSKKQQAQKKEGKNLGRWVPAQLVAEGLNEIKSIHLSPDSSRLVVASDYKTVSVWPISDFAERGDKNKALKAEPQLSLTTQHYGVVWSAHFSPDGQHILTASSDNMSWLIDSQTGRESLSYDGHAMPVKSAEFSDDGSKVVLASDDRTSTIYETQTGKLVGLLRGHDQHVRFAEFSANGKFVVTASWDGTARIWNTETHNQIQLLDTKTQSTQSSVETAKFSPDGKKVVTASFSQGVTIWNAQTGRPLRKLNDPNEQVFTSARFSPNGKEILTTGSEGTEIWDAATGEKIDRLDLPDEHIIRADYSRSGDLVVTATAKGRIHVWRKKTRSSN